MRSERKGRTQQPQIWRRGLWIVPVCAALLAGCNRASTEAAASDDPPARAPVNPLQITPNEDLRKTLKIGTPYVADVSASLTVAGRLEADETRITRVGSPIMGRITSLAAREGQEVERGQLLAVLNSPELSESQLALLKALSQQQVQQRAVERAQILLKAEVIGSAELQRREAELAQATAELAAARDQLVLLGMPPEAVSELEKTRSINSLARITASMAGTVLDRRITLGQVIQPADTAFEIADLQSVWLVADVPEQNAGTLAVGHRVEAEIAAFPGDRIHGALSFVSATVNPETRTVRVRMDLPNPSRKYKPAMLATMVLIDRTERKQVVPATAVVREENVDHVFVQVEGGAFLLRPVTLGEEANGRRVLIEGVQPGERIVIDGAFHLNNERRRLVLRGNEG
jgi:cobalt-zinc-cadmium efflux system membrane fusion protein